MNEQTFKRLLEGYLNETLTSDELRSFLDQVKKRGDDQVLLQHIEQQIRTASAQDPARAAASLENFMARVSRQPLEPTIGHQAGKYVWLKKTMRYAAVLVLACCITAVILLVGKNKQQKQTGTTHRVALTIPDHQVQLQLEDGRVVVLDSLATASRVLASQRTRYSAGSNQLVYEKGARRTSGSHSLSTGRGSQVSVVLPDGTRAWLNAKSDLAYPAQFGQGQRQVELTGEAYFDVTHDPGKPFVVKTSRATVTVLGTSFNLRVYQEDSAVITSTYAGQVLVTGGDKRTTVIAGQQLIITKAGDWRLGSPAEFEAATGWKDHIFNFQKTPLPAILLELARWYAIDYKIDPLNRRTFSGKIPRSEDFSTVLKVLKESGISFQQDGNKVVFFD